jgi:hypothetical protein
LYDKYWALATVHNVKANGKKKGTDGLPIFYPKKTEKELKLIDTLVVAIDKLIQADTIELEE